MIVGIVGSASVSQRDFLV